MWGAVRETTGEWEKIIKTSCITACQKEKAENDYTMFLIIPAFKLRPVRESNPQLALRSMAYHLVHRPAT